MILHIDMDAFYASVEIRDNPALAGRPVVVGGSAKGRGVVSAASYEARKYGIHSAMSAAEAVRRCPQAVFLKPRMAHYANISRQIREIFGRYTSLIEPLSLDEAFLDVHGCTHLFGPAPQIAKEIKRVIAQELGLVASAGVAPNKFLAKVASDLEKPNGWVVVEPGAEQAFLDPLPIGRVWGVGRKTEQKFARIGVRTVADLRQLPRAVLVDHFGIMADHFWNLSRGVDSRPVVPDREAKSVSHEHTFAADIHDLEALQAWTWELADQVGRRLRRYGITARTVQLKLRHADFRTVTRSHTLPRATHGTRELAEAAMGMLGNIPRGACGVRLLGVGATKLARTERQQLWLFDRAEDDRDHRLDAAADQIKDRFGGDALQRANQLQFGSRHRAIPRPGDDPNSTDRDR